MLQLEHTLTYRIRMGQFAWFVAVALDVGLAAPQLRPRCEPRQGRCRCGIWAHMWGGGGGKEACVLGLRLFWNGWHRPRS